MDKNYVSVGDLKKLFESLDDNIPVLSRPLNRDIAVRFGIGIDEKGKFEDYEGKIVNFEVSLVSIQTGRPVLLVDENEPEPIRVKYSSSDFNPFQNFMLGGENKGNAEVIKEDVIKDVAEDEQGNN